EEGLTDMCFLMELELGQLPNKTRRMGVISGLPCNKTWEDQVRHAGNAKYCKVLTEDSFDLAAVERWLASAPDSIAAGSGTGLDASGIAQAAASSGSARASAAEAAASTPGLDPAPESACGPIEEDVAYWAWSLLGEMHNVPNARECRGKCALVPGCGAWTWGKARGVDDLSDICFLKGHSAKLQDSRHKARGVSSGLCGAGAAAEDGSPRMTIVLGSNDVDRAAGRQGAILPMSSIKSPEKSSTAVLSTTVTATTRVATATTTFTSTTANVLTSTTVLTTITTVLTSTLTSETSATYTQTTSTKTPSRATSTTGPIALPEKVDGELFCFAVMVPGSEEQSLLVIAFQNSAGIFNCDMNTIYSSLEFELAPGVVTHKVASDLHCESGGEFNTALNLEIFLEVWRSVVADGDFTRFEWTVKVDPDSVFFPDRLRVAIQKHQPAEYELGIYLNNCDFGLHGPIEVFSRRAVETWWEGSQKCLDHFWEMCSGDCNWGEDIFIDQCLWKVLNATRYDEHALLVEDHCSPPEGWRDCQDSWHIAFHPFKTGWEWMQCFENAKAHQD
ncbi:unnamed protein product, partial [Prorocentrum cordatum]